MQVLVSRDGRQFNNKSTAAVELRIGKDATVVAFCDALGDCQAQAVAATVLGTVQALERLEQFVRIAHVETDSMVVDGHA